MANDDADVAELVEAWVGGATQVELSRRLGLAGNSAVSLRLRRFVSRYLPGRSFKYAEVRKKAAAEALVAYHAERRRLMAGPEFPSSMLVKFDLDWTRLSPAERSLLQALIEKMTPKRAGNRGRG